MRNGKKENKKSRTIISEILGIALELTAFFSTQLHTHTTLQTKYDNER